MNDIMDPMKKEGLRRLKILQQQIGLNPKAEMYYRADKLYYSYFIAYGLIGSIDVISYKPENEKIVRNVEKQYGIHVYHVIESSFPFQSLILLYIEKDKSEWEKGRPKEGHVPAYVYNFETEEGEFKDIVVFARSGALFRIG